MNTYQVYVLINNDGKRYIGISENIHIRLQQHNQGISTWTAKFRPWSIAWSSQMLSLSEARKLENTLKRAKGGTQFYAITGLSHSGS